MQILITGSAGFIGFHLCKKLLSDGHKIIGIDNLNDYYNVNLKNDRLKLLKKYRNFSFLLLNIANWNDIKKVFKNNNFDIVVNLAAQTGVRYSLENPFAYADSNLTGFINILEGCRHTNLFHFIYASSSSVYGMNKKIPFSVDDNVDCPLSLYAATKKSNELMAYSYSHLFNIPITGLRFFTVYGPWGRPDMAYFKFTKAILDDKPINIYNHGDMKRDFTYIDDIINGIVLVMTLPPVKNDNNFNIKNEIKNSAPYKIYNIGNNKPVNLIEFIKTLENELEKKAKKNMMPMQHGDMPLTYADIDSLIKDVGFKPKTEIKSGLKKFIKWFKDYYKK